MKILHISYGEEFDIVCFDENFVFKRYSFNDWQIISERPFFADNDIEELEKKYHSFKPHRDDYRDKVIIEISLKLLDDGISDFNNRLKPVVDAIMEYRDENNM
jgi:hypothetical protein